LKTEKERHDNLNCVVIPDIPISKMRDLMRKINEEFISLGEIPYTIEEED
jgi:hypothetical protein